MPNKYFEVDGTATYLHYEGATTLPGVVPDFSRGERVLCLHGAGGNGHAFKPLLERLAAQHSPLAFDFPGHARSGGLDSLGSAARMAAFAMALVERLALRRPVLLGHSLGGAVAIHCALEHPDRVRGLVLCGSAARFPIPEERLEQMRRVTEGKERRAFSRDAYSPATSGDVVRQGIMEDLKTDPRAVYGDYLACRDCDLIDRLGEIAVPTLVIFGEDEIPGLREQSELLAGSIRGATRVEVPKAGHMVHFEQPDAVAGAVADFLGGLGP